MVEGPNAFCKAVLILFSILGVTFSEPNRGVYTHCSQTERNRLDSTPRTIIPVRTSASTVPKSVTETNALSLNLCPNRGFLKISWISNQTQEDEIYLCYRMDSTHNDMIMETVCSHLHIYESPYLSALDCWFPMKFIDRKPIVTAWVYSLTSTLQWIFSGSLNTGVLDPGNTCKDMCEVVAMNIGSQINCHDKASIIYDTSTVVKQLSFHAIDKTACENNILRISRQTDGRLEYQLSCGFNGLGHVKVLYITHGRYCLKYQLVTVRCYNGSSTPIPLTNEPENIHSFGTFMIFGCVCIVIITAAFFGIVFFVQWLMNVRASYFKSKRDSMTDSRNISVSGEDSAPLHIEKIQLTENIPQCSSENTNRTLLPRQPSRRRFSTTSLSKVPEMVPEKQGLMVSKMRKSITMALLEDTNPFYKKKILFLPIPFDHFTNEVTKILKTIFSSDAGLVSQCCYDRNVYKHYMTSDRLKWIDNVLGDHDRILIFLCFKSLCAEQVEGKHATMVEEVLDKLLVSKVEPIRLCKVVFLYLTDSSDNVTKTHHGDIFHICDYDSFKRFICDVMNFSGRSLDEYPDMIDKLLNCKSSKHFLHYIGIKRTPRK